MTAKQRIVVLYGGRADEHPISCISAAGVLKAIDRERFEPIPVGITREGLWLVGGEDPRGWDLGGEHLPEVTVSAEARPVLLDIARGQTDFMLAATQSCLPGFLRSRIRLWSRSRCRSSRRPEAGIDFPGPY